MWQIKYVAHLRYATVEVTFDDMAAACRYAEKLHEGNDVLSEEFIDLNNPVPCRFSQQNH